MYSENQLFLIIGYTALAVFLISVVVQIYILNK